MLLVSGPAMQGSDENPEPGVCRRTAAARAVRRAVAWALAACAAALSLGGCSSLPQAGAPEPPPAVLRLEVATPNRVLRQLLEQHLDLARVNRLAAGEPLQEGELDRLVAAAPQQVRDLADTEGYFNATIDVARVPDTAPPTVRVTVEPGPRTHVGRVDLTSRGALASGADAGLAHAQRTQQSFVDGWPMPAGAPFRGADWSRAKTASLASLRARGYVQAEWAETEATVDAAAQRADLAATVESGPLFRTGGLRVQGLARQDQRTVHRIADLRPGVPATEELLLDIQERLQASDLFDRATVTLVPDASDPEHTPVLVQLGERRLQEATIGVGVGANVGPRVTLDHVHRRPFGEPWVARSKFDVSHVEQKYNGEISTQTLPGLYRNLVGASVDRVVSNTDIVNTRSIRAGRAQDMRRIDRQWFVEFQRSTTSSALGHEQDDAVAFQFQGIWRRLDNLVLPTRGLAWQTQLGSGFAKSTPGGQGPFARAYARVDGYHPLGSTWYGQARVELGQVFSNADVRVPQSLRFRAGGDESVRGYAYRSLTSVVDGVDVGGKVLFTSSVEAARPFIDRIPDLWGAVFVDVGRAALRWSDLNPAWGAGVGLRYRSPVGPVKLDVAYGEEVHRWRLHLSVGMAF